MSDFREDKVIERERYDRRAASMLAKDGFETLGLDGAEGIPIELRKPYLVYEGYIRRHVQPGMRVLDLCCGNGQHSLTAARLGAYVTVSDIAPKNVEVALKRAQRVGLCLEGIVGDAEALPCNDATFDMVTCAGSLSYVDCDRFLGEVWRLLCPGGIFACVDSLNHNPIYRLNRRIRYWRGERSLSVIRRTPTLATIRALWQTFPMDAEVSFHGIFSFLMPFLRPVCGRICTAQILHKLDAHCAGLQRYAFKFVFCGGVPQNKTCIKPTAPH